MTPRLHSWPTSFVSLYLGCEPKVRVVTYAINNAYNLRCLCASRVLNEYMLSIMFIQMFLLLIICLLTKGCLCRLIMFTQDVNHVLILFS